jgi:branched-chain amino acid transport system substrate-binding protein
MSSGLAAIYTTYTSAAAQLIPEGKTKLATIVCVEAQLCRDMERLGAESAAALGFDYVYRAQTSLAQPDFTAECLNARNAGAQIIIILLDANSIGRISSSCARQGYKPIYATVSSILTEQQQDDPNLAGMIASSTGFVWFQTGTPATDEFQTAVRLMGSNVPKGIGPTVGWTAGKLLERAGAALPEPPTSAALLNGLWSIKDDTLGGLTQPLTFTEGQPAKPISCWFDLRVVDHKWTNPDHFTQHCRPAPAGTR